MFIKNKILVYCSAFLLLTYTSCNPHLDLPDQPVDSYTKVYMPQAINTPVNCLLKIADSAQTIIYSADYGGQGYPGKDITVNFEVNNNLVDSFNKANNTTYAIMPDKSYTISQATAVIPAGQLSTGPLTIAVKTNGTGAINILKDYLLPVTMHTSDEKVNAGLSTTFFKVRAQPDLNDYPVYDRSPFTIAGFSSQEANGEGANNGRAVFVLDNNSDTYWHTQWQGASPGPPHFVTIDMGAVKTVHGLYFLDRQSDNNGKPKDVQVQVSLDNVNFTDAGAFTLANTKDLQYQFLSVFADARYVKVIIQNSYGASYTHLAELKIF